LQRTDDALNVQWQIPLNFSPLQAFHAADGGILLLGYSYGLTTGRSLVLEKRDAQGNPQWTRKLPVDLDIRFVKLLTNPRGDQYWLSVPGNDYTKEVETFDLNGNLLGQTNLGKLFYIWSLHVSGDNGLVVTNYGLQSDKFFGSVTKYNARLVQEWHKDTGNKGYSFMIPVGDGYLFITNGQAVEKRNNKGKLLWSRPIQKGAMDEYDFVATADGGALLFATYYRKAYSGTGTVRRPLGAPRDYAVLVLKLDAEGAYCP
jgi:hypothetical protein